jgi:KaiC/GvpD/RAD55 family RecA-like ATPase
VIQQHAGTNRPQTLVNGARQFGELGIFVAFEENSRHILANAASFG